MQHSPGQIGALVLLAQLGQSTPANTTAASLVAGAAGVVKVITEVHVVNITASPAKFRLFHDNDGTTYDTTTTVIGYDVQVDPGFSFVLSGLNLAIANSAGNFAVRTDTNSAFTFTAYGYSI
jgi:hypothetical protein